MSEIAAIREALRNRPRTADLSQRRKLTDERGQQFPLPPDVVVQPVTANGVRAEWSSSPGANAGRALLYLHGGLYCFGSLGSHRHLVAEIGRAARLRTLALDYRLAPEHPFPAAVEDAIAGYRFLLSEGLEPRNIIIAGDSAGGGLTVATLVSLREHGLPQPLCGWCISPWTDMEAKGSSMTTKVEEDPFVERPDVLAAAGRYLDGADPRSPLASPIHADLRDISPLLIQVGSSEVFLDDSMRLASAVAEADGQVVLEVWPRMIHVWHLFHPRLGEGRQAIAAGARFIGSLAEPS